MHVEISVALNFVISYMYNKLPRRRVNVFGDLLEKGLKRKFEGHWYPEKSCKGSAFRCVRVSADEMDPVVEWSAGKCGLDVNEVREYLPKDLTIWIDPSEVSYRIGEKGLVKILYSDRRPDAQEETVAMDNEVQNVSRGFNPEAQSFRPIDSLSSSLTNLSLSPSPSGWGSITPPGNTSNPMTSSTSPVTPFVPRHANATTFTAAAFAATKFGSTKLKSQAKRPSRLSPTEFGSYVKQRNGFHLSSPGQPPMLSNGMYYAGSPNTPVPGAVPGMPSPLQPQHARSLSPRSMRQDYIDQQNRLLLLQQQQQLQQQHAHQQQQQYSQQHAQSPVQQQQQQQQQQSSMLLGNINLLSPTIGSPGDLYHSAPQSAAVSPSTSGSFGSVDMLPSPGTGSLPNLLGTTSSPTEPSKTFMDSLNWSTLTPYANLQHLLVAN